LLVSVGFNKRRVIHGQAAVHLVGAQMQKAKGCLLIGRQRGPVRAHDVQQSEDAHDVGLNEFARAVNAAIYMALDREVNHCARAMLCQQALDQACVADVALHRAVSGITGPAGQVFEVAGEGQLVEGNMGLAGLCQPVAHEICSNETGGAGKGKSHLTKLGFLGDSQILAGD
jgi:hypothetical protein